MSIACGDVDGDGREDLLVTNFRAKTTLYQSKGPTFREHSRRRAGGARIPMLGWGTALVDFDLDGDSTEAFNGHVYPQADNPGTDTSYAQWRSLSRRRGKVRGGAAVRRACARDALRRTGTSTATATSTVASESTGSCVLRNTTLPREKGLHWLRVQLRSKSGNRFALGARVLAEWQGGKRAAEVRTSGGYQASVPPEVHFGLGAASKLELLTIRWPSGREQRLTDVAVDRVLVLEESAQ